MTARARSIAVIVGIAILAGTGCMIDRESESTSPTAEPPASASAGPPRVRLVFRPAPGSERCCVAITVNPGEETLRVKCSLAAFDRAGHVIFTGIFPPPFPGHRRSIGFSARPGRDQHGFFETPIDLRRHSYEATCRVALWHGAPVI